jgi:hypothetical protein
LITIIAGIDIADAIKRQVVLIVTRSIDTDVRQAPVAGDFVIVRVDDSWSQTSQRKIAAPINWDVLYLLRRNRRTALGAFRLQLLAT